MQKYDGTQGGKLSSFFATGSERIRASYETLVNLNRSTRGQLDRTASLFWATRRLRDCNKSFATVLDTPGVRTWFCIHVSEERNGCSLVLHGHHYSDADNLYRGLTPFRI